jgi:hypothetical protein
VGAAVAVQLACAEAHQVLACAGAHPVLGAAGREVGVVSAGVEAIGAVAPGVELTGAAETGKAGTGVAAIGTSGMAETGTVVIGAAATGTIGVTTITMTMTMISSSLVASDFHGGVGAGVLAGAGAIRTDMATVTEVTHMAATVTGVTHMVATVTEVTHMAATDMETVAGVGPESPSYSAGSLALVTIMGPLTASWDRRRVELFAPTSKTAATAVNLVFRRKQSQESRFSLGLGLSSGS